MTLADLNDIQVELDINQNDFNRIAAEPAMHGRVGCVSGQGLQMPRRGDCSGSESAEGDRSGESEVSGAGQVSSSRR